MAGSMPVKPKGWSRTVTAGTFTASNAAIIAATTGLRLHMLSVSSNSSASCNGFVNIGAAATATLPRVASWSKQDLKYKYAEVTWDFGEDGIKADAGIYGVFGAGNYIVTVHTTALEQPELT